jgi:hypothetical protein
MSRNEIDTVLDETSIEGLPRRQRRAAEELLGDRSRRFRQALRRHVRPERDTEAPARARRG